MSKYKTKKILIITLLIMASMTIRISAKTSNNDSIIELTTMTNDIKTHRVEKAKRQKQYNRKATTKKYLAKNNQSFKKLVNQATKVNVKIAKQQQENSELRKQVMILRRQLDGLKDLLEIKHQRVKVQNTANNRR